MRFGFTDVDASSPGKSEYMQVRLMKEKRLLNKDLNYSLFLNIIPSYSSRGKQKL